MCATHTLGVERCGLCYVMPQEDFYSAQHRDRTQCLLKSRNLTVSPNAVAIFRVRMYDAHESRLAATVITDSGALAGGGVTRHFSEAKAALRLTYGPARGILQHVVQDGDVVPDDFPLEPTCNLFDSRDPRVGNRRHACIDTYERGSVSCADESPTGIYYFWVQATDKGWSGAIVPSLHFSGSLGDAGYCHVTLGIALFASLPTSFIALAACACARLRWLVPEKQRDRREGQCLVFTVVAFIFAASPALYASFVIHQRLSLLW
jgi:hypothetical protein